MQKIIALALFTVMLVSSIAFFSAPAHAADATSQTVKAAFGDSNIIFGPRIGITNATYLGSITINGQEVAYYELQSGEHYVTDAPAQKDLDWSYVQSNAQVKIENFDVPTGNKNVTAEFGSGSVVFTSSDEIEGAEVLGDYIYITYRRTSANIEMRTLSDFSLVKSTTIGDSTFYHVGGIVADDSGHLWTVLGKTTDSGPAYVYEFDSNLTEITHWETDNDHYGTVFAVEYGKIYLGNWDCDQIAIFNITTHELIEKFNTPEPFQKTQDTAYLGNGYYLGARYDNYNYSGLYLYHFDNGNLSFDTNLIAYASTGGNPVAVDDLGNMYAWNNGLYKTSDVFLPLLYANITSGDKYNIGLSDVWPCQDTGHEQFTFGGTGSELAIGFEDHAGSLQRTTVINSSTTGKFYLSYYGTYANLNGHEVPGGLPTSGTLTKIGAQTWGSATQNLQGSLYLLKAVPYIVTTPASSGGDNGTGGENSGLIAIPSVDLSGFTELAMTLISVLVMVYFIYTLSNIAKSFTKLGGRK